MEEMNSSFKIIMFLIHFNPINLMLKYRIIKFESFTDIIIKTKEYINSLTLEKAPLTKDYNVGRVYVEEPEVVERKSSALDFEAIDKYLADAKEKDLLI